MPKTKVIIIDDELSARNLLNNLLTEYCKDAEVIATCVDLPNGVKAIRKLKPDLVFLDIEMPGHSGLELLDFFDAEEVNFAIIFTTAYSEYAVKAFKLSAMDYLLKPIEPSELEASFDRFRKKTTNEKAELSLQIENIKNPQKNKIGIPTQQGFKFVDVNEIVFIKADNSYTELINTKNEKIIISRTLKNFEEVLQDAPNFVRVHKSYLVNTNYINDYVKSDGGYLVMQGNHQVSISADKVEAALKDKLFVRR
jgi:two-component system LytT family response regulator